MDKTYPGLKEIKSYFLIQQTESTSQSIQITDTHINKFIKHLYNNYLISNN